MLRRMLCSAPAAAVALLLLATSSAWAAMGQPSPGEMGLQGAATPVAEKIHEVYDFVNIIIVAIAVFVMLLLLQVSLIIKMVLRWTINLKYIVAMPEIFFNI